MQLTDIKISGFRSLRNTVLSSLAPYNAIVGRNNSGKTALLHSFLLFESIRHGDTNLEALRQTHPWDRSIEQVILESMGGRPSAGRITATLDFIPGETEIRRALKIPPEGREELISATLRYELQLAVGDSTRPDAVFVPVRASIVADDSEYHLMSMSGINGRDVTYQVPADHSQLRSAIRGRAPSSVNYHNYGINVDTLAQRTLQDEADDQTAVLTPFMQWIRGIRFVSRTRQPSHAVGIQSPELLRSDGSNLPRFIQYLLNNEPPAWDELKAIFRELVPWLHDVFSPISQGNTSTRMTVTADQGAAEAFELGDMGAGTTHLMTIIAMVWSAPPGALCLVDEPEQGLHSSAQRDLALWLEWHAAATGKQIVVATHSTIFARPAAGRSIYLSLYTPENGTQCRTINTSEAIDIAGELGMRLADTFAFDYALFVEGDSEYVAIPLIAASLGIDLPSLSVQILPLHGDPASRLKRLKELLVFMRGSQVTPYIILDSDPGVQGAVQRLVDDGTVESGNVWLWTGDSNRGEFEDNLPGEKLVELANQVARAAGSKAQAIRPAELVDLRAAKPKTATSKLLSELYFSHYGYGLPKPELARRIAEFVSDRIAKGDRKYPVVDALDHLREVVTAKMPAIR